MNPILLSRFEEGRPKLAIRFPAAAVKGAGLALAAAMAEEGRLVSGEASTPWRFESIVQDEEGALLVGPDPVGLADAVEEGARAESLDEAKSLEAGLTRILSLARALTLLKGEGRLPRGIVSSAVLFAKGRDESILLLPPAATARALTASGVRSRSAAVARLSSPRSTGPEADASFLLALAAYRFATGKSAFERESGEPSGVAGPVPGSTTIALAAPRLHPGLAAIVDRALADPGSAPLSEWLECLETAREAGWTREIPPEEMSALARRREAAEAQARSRKRREDFFRRRGALVVGLAAVVVVLALIAGDMLRAQKDKPDFSGLSPRELVRRYYLAVDTIDLDSLEACGDKKAIKNDEDTLINLTVLTKTRTAYEGKSPVVRAESWVASGKPQLAPDAFLYGIDDLAITEESGYGGDRAVFKAEYSLWYLDKPDSAPLDAASVPTESRRSDILTLERGKRGWRIVDLERKTLS